MHILKKYIIQGHILAHPGIPWDDLTFPNIVPGKHLNHFRSTAVLKTC